MSNEIDKIKAEEVVENIDPNSGTAQYIFNLIMKSTLPEARLKEIEDRLIDGDIHTNELDGLLSKLLDSRIDPIDSGNPYSMKDIHKKLDKMEGKI